MMPLPQMASRSAKGFSATASWADFPLCRPTGVHFSATACQTANSRIVGKPKVIRVGTERISIDKSAYSEQSLRPPQACLSLPIRRNGELPTSGLLARRNFGLDHHSKGTDTIEARPSRNQNSVLCVLSFQAGTPNGDSAISRGPPCCFSLCLRLPPMRKAQWNVSRSWRRMGKFRTTSWCSSERSIAPAAPSAAVARATSRKRLLMRCRGRNVTHDVPPAVGNRHESL